MRANVLLFLLYRLEIKFSYSSYSYWCPTLLPPLPIPNPTLISHMYPNPPHPHWVPPQDAVCLHYFSMCLHSGWWHHSLKTFWLLLAEFCLEMYKNYFHGISFLTLRWCRLLKSFLIEYIITRSCLSYFFKTMAADDLGPLSVSCWELCSAIHRAVYFSNVACDWLIIVWAYSQLETESRPWWCKEPAHQQHWYSRPRTWP